MSEKQLGKVDFEIIRYSNCWEDADVLLKGLNVDQNSTIMSIASAGDNCFSLASTGVRKVIAFDISLVQLHLVELKMEAIRQLNREEYMGFAGIREASSRLDTYAIIREKLSEKCKFYWDQNIDAISLGVIHAGKFEQYFQTFKMNFLHTVHSQGLVDQLLAEKSEEEQLKFHDDIWNSAEWEILYKDYFGEKTLGDKGRDPEFLKHVEGSVAEMNLRRAKRHLRTKMAQENYFLNYILNNRFNADLPHYVRQENFSNVKRNLDRVELHHGLLDSALECYPNCTHFNLSDIFEYMDEDLFSIVGNQIIENSAPQAKIAYWNLLIERNLANVLPKKLNFDLDNCKILSASDLGYFYRAFIVNSKV